MAYWRITLEVKRADIIDITKVNVFEKHDIYNYTRRIRNVL